MAMLLVYLFFAYCALITTIHSHIFRLNQVNTDTLHAITEIEHPGSAVAQVHNPVSNVRSPIIDPNNDPLAIFQVRHLYKASQRELPVRGSEFEHVEVLTAGSGLAVKLLPIPGCGSYLIGFGFSL